MGLPLVGHRKSSSRLRIHPVLQAPLTLDTFMFNPVPWPSRILLGCSLTGMDEVSVVE